MCIRDRSILYNQQQSRGENMGYVGTFLKQVQQVAGTCIEKGIKIVTNAGGLNPKSMADEIEKIIEEQGLTAKVAWIDTENTFRGDRLESIADRFGLDREAVLSNVIVARVDTVDQMMQALIAVGAKMAEEPFRLLVVDSIMAIFRVDYVARGELSERQQTLNQFLSRLRKLAEEFNVAIVLTNQVQSDPGGMAFAGVEPKKAIGGHVLAHASTIRIQVRKGRAEARVMKVLQGPTLKENEAEFQITEGGVTGMD